MPELFDFPGDHATCVHAHLRTSALNHNFRVARPRMKDGISHRKVGIFSTQTDRKTNRKVVKRQS